MTLMLAAGCSGSRDNGKKAKEDRPVPIRSARVLRKTMPVELQVVGSVTPKVTVAVTAQVGGQLVKVLFQPGDFVQEGQALFLLDSRSQQASLEQLQALAARDHAQIAQGGAQLQKDQALLRQAQLALGRDQAAIQQARANLAKDQAQLEYAQAQDRRYQELLNQGYVTREQAEQQHANALTWAGTVRADQAQVEAARATLELDRANVASAQATREADSSAVRSAQANLQADLASADNARVQLGYTEIRAPLSGRTGTLNLHEGTVIRANDSTPLVTIDEVRPIQITFAVPEKYLGEIRRQQERKPLLVQVRAEGESKDQTGRVTFLENTVDSTTGTITLRADFPNRDLRPWPGQFVQVRLLLKKIEGALVVPSQAVQPGQKGDFVFVVKADNTVELKPVEVDFAVGDETVLKSGPAAGEVVVTDGQLQLTPGAKVEEVKPR